MTLVVQLVGVLMVVGGAVWLVGPWALLVSGLLLLVVPELVEGRGRAAREVQEARRS